MFLQGVIKMYETVKRKYWCIGYSLLPAGKRNNNQVEVPSCHLLREKAFFHLNELNQIMSKVNG